MRAEAHPCDEAAEQIVHDRSLIDHLITTFHSDSRDGTPAAEQPQAIYDQIRREWPSSLTLGTRC